MADFPKKTRSDWEKLAARELRDKPLDSLDWTTPEGIVVKPLYTAEDLENLESVGIRHRDVQHHQLRLK